MKITQLSEEIMYLTPSGNRLYWMITEEDGAPLFELRYFEIPPLGGTSYGKHPYEHEVFIVKGYGAVKSGDKEIPLTPGVAVFVPGGEEHQWINLKDDGPFGFVCVIPKGMENEFKPKNGI
jgi:quercetin dioxygenase-like cupin family protein